MGKGIYSLLKGCMTCDGVWIQARHWKVWQRSGMWRKGMIVIMFVAVQGNRRLALVSTIANTLSSNHIKFCHCTVWTTTRTIDFLGWHFMVAQKLNSEHWC